LKYLTKILIKPHIISAIALNAILSTSIYIHSKFFDLVVKDLKDSIFAVNRLTEGVNH